MNDRRGSARAMTAKRRPFLALAAVALAFVGALAPAAAGSARAAADGLSLTTRATYTIDPPHAVVRVVVDVTARNNKPDTVAGAVRTRYFYDSFRIAIQPEARAVSASGAGRPLVATARAVQGYRILEVHFAQSLFYQQTTTVRVTFDLPGGEPRSDSQVRVGSAFATFVAWAFGDVASVRIVVPAGFEAEATGSDVDRGTFRGGTLFTASGIADIASWAVTVNADRKSALTNVRLSLAGGEHVAIRAWPEDTVWLRQVEGLLRTGLPELVALTGLPWPVSGDLSVFEVHTPLLEGYAGVFFEGQDRIEISENLDDLTILHESSHAWFNGQLFAGRWINEGFADTYASRALDSIGEPGWAPDPVAPTDKAAVQLNDWVHPGRIADAETDAREQYGYNAAWTVIRTIDREIGDDPMRRVLAAAQKHEIAYVGAGAAETIDGVTDWRRLLDLFDERGGSRAADDLFRRFVVAAADTKVLDKRAAARTAYAALVQAAADWAAPLYVRQPMSDWSFSDATTRIAEADAVLSLRDRIAALARSIGVPAPSDLRTVYQLATTTLDGAAALAERELTAGQELRAASDAVAAPRDPLVTIGLVGETPEADLSVARSQFSAGAPGAAAAAIAVSALMAGADEVGRERLIIVAAAVVVAAVLCLIAAVLIRRRRRARRLPARAAVAATSVIAGSVAGWGATPMDGTAVRGDERSRERDHPDALDHRSEPGSDPGWEAQAPYATLADQSADRPAADPPSSGQTTDAGSSHPTVNPASPSPTDRGDAS